MVTALRLGPQDQGTPLSLEAFLSASYQEGFKYELIDGKLAVSPHATVPEDWVRMWIYDLLRDYSRRHPSVLNHVTAGARVFVPGRANITAPEPKGTAYCDFPLHLPIREIGWEDISPVLVIEVVSAKDPDKDFVRNAELYLQVASIKEYWVFDTRSSARFPELHTHHRDGKKWRIRQLGGGATYTTRLLPDFKLVLDTRPPAAQDPNTRPTNDSLP